MGCPKKEVRPKPKSQLEEYREKMERERREREGLAKPESGEGQGERSKTENGSHPATNIANGSTKLDGPIVIDEEPSGPVDVLSSILSSQAVTQSSRKPAGPTTVETKEGWVEIPGRSFPNLQYRGVQYSVGDFVYVRSERGGEPEIHRIERFFEREGIRTILGRRFYRAKMETFHEPTRIFYEKELARSSLNAIMPISRLLSRCYVMPAHHYNTHQAEGVAEKDTYVCEFNYFPKLRQWEKIEQGDFWKPPAGVKIVAREQPLGAKRMEEVQHGKRRANPISVQVSDSKKSDVLSSILGDGPLPKKGKHSDEFSLTTVGNDAAIRAEPSKPKVSEPTPPSRSNFLSSVLASQGQLSVTGVNVPPKQGRSGDPSSSAPPPDRLSGLLGSGLSVKPAVDTTSKPRANDEKDKTTSSQNSLLASGLSVKPATETSTFSAKPRALDPGPPPQDRLSGLLASGISVTKRSVPVPSPGVTAQEAASYNSMFSI